MPFFVDLTQIYIRPVMNISPAQERTSIILIVFGTILFSSKVIMTKWAFIYGASPLVILVLRMLSAAPFYLIIGAIASYRSTEPIVFKDKVIIFILGLIGYYFSSFLDFTGMQYISSGLERMILYLYPTFVILISAVVLRQKVTKDIILSLSLSYIGILCMFFGDIDFNQSDQLLGAGLVTGAAFSFAIFLIVGGKLIKRIGTLRYTSYAMLTSAAALSIHFTIDSGFSFQDTSKEVILIGCGVGALCTVLPSFMINRGLAVLGPEKVSIYGAVGPVSVFILGTILYDESITILKILGAFLVILGGLTLSLKGRVKASIEKFRLSR